MKFRRKWPPLLFIWKNSEWNPFLLITGKLCNVSELILQHFEREILTLPCIPHVQQNHNLQQQFRLAWISYPTLVIGKQDWFSDQGKLEGLFLVQKLLFVCQAQKLILQTLSSEPACIQVTTDVVCNPCLLEFILWELWGKLSEAFLSPTKLPSSNSLFYLFATFWSSLWKGLL